MANVPLSTPNPLALCNPNLFPSRDCKGVVRKTSQAGSLPGSTPNPLAFCVGQAVPPASAATAACRTRGHQWVN